jgi:heat shock protein HtpX
MPFVKTAELGPRMPEFHSHLFGSYVRTAMLMAGLVALLAIGGRAFGGTQGMLLFGAFGLITNFAMYWFSDRIALAAHRAEPVTRAEAPTIYAIVERLTRRAGLPMPRIFVIPSGAANAFATGRNPDHAAVAVTDGILDVLSEPQLEAVLAHELSHVKNRDVLIATIAAAVAGLVSTIGHVMRWGLMLGGLRGDDNRRVGGLEALAWIIVAPIMALFIQLAISRSREFAADASGAALCGHPENLAGALARLEQAKDVRPYEFAGPATAHLFIVNPLRGAAAAFMSLLSTHPPIEERIRRLQAMQVSG